MKIFKEDLKDIHFFIGKAARKREYLPNVKISHPQYKTQH